MKLANLFGVVALVALCTTSSGEPRQRGTCYQLTESCPGAPPAVRRQGRSLRLSDIASLCASFQVLSRLESDCGIMAPPGAPPGKQPSELLSDLLGSGDICLETANDVSGRVGASASNPIVGNGRNSRTGCELRTTGHPGINVAHCLIPMRLSNGQFSAGSQMSLLGSLLHELYHLYDTQDPTSQADYEDEATAYAIGEMCKVAGCAKASQDEKDGACSFITDQNKQRCNHKLKQVCCDDCPNKGKVHCETSAKRWIAGGPSGSGSASPARSLLAYWTEPYLDGISQGTVSLDVANQIIEFDLRDNFGSRVQFHAPLGSPPGFTGACFLLDPNGAASAWIGGWDSFTGEGMLVRMDFDPIGGTVLRQDVLVRDRRMKTVSTISSFPGARRYALGDHVAHSVFVYDAQGQRVDRVASMAQVPSLAATQYVHVYAVGRPLWPQGGGSPGGAMLRPLPLPLGPGTILECTPWPEPDLGFPGLAQRSVHFLDEDGDGVFERTF